MSSPPRLDLDQLTLEDLVPQSGIELSLGNSSKRAVVEQLLSRLEAAGSVADRQQVLQDLLEREGQGSTALGHGVAFPHAKTAGARQPALAFGRCLQGVDFAALDGQPVRLVFLLIVPRWRAGLHLRILAALSRFLSSEDNRRQLMSAAEDSAVRDLLRQVSIR